ncbi:DUF2189 domain-containing protein [Rhizobacter sp. Root404]|uniref:DUF2189 domain-containing protein n=1 Tax=Rhizobacter sp. Root404 TaxID=1736528 RepID=UPI0009E98AB2|nr:DUF2189 domain-containing protein [Rhizobacter sp. Root404]
MNTTLRPDPAPLADTAGPAAGAADAARVDAAPIRLNPLAATAPFQWLKLGWRDFTRAPLLGLFYGACFAAMGGLLMLLFRQAPAWVLALSAGFLLVGPFLCLGLYDTSRRLERGERPQLGRSLVAWRTRSGTMAIFGAVLLVIEMLWARASLVVFALSFDGMPDFKGSLLALLDPQNLTFIVAYLIVGGLFATLIFACSVVAMPMILDRETDAISAGITSIRLCLAQPGVMLLWGLTITAIVVVALLPWFLGLLVAAPVLGHASWHAYRAAVANAN